MASQSIIRITPQALSLDHTLLLHKKDHNQPSRDFEHGDGRVGAVVGNGEWFVTSPNMDFVPQLVLGRTHNMRIRANFRYGEDDPLQWPQPYFPSDCHLGAIPLRPGPDDAMSIMWWDPEPKDFVPTTATTIGGLGLINRGHFTYLSHMVSSLCYRAEEFMSTEPSGKKNEVIPSFMTVVMQGMKRLENLPMSRRQVFMNVRYVQRCYLELLAALDYLEVFRPRMRGLRPAASIAELRMGVFTYDPIVVQDFMRAGLPVWLIRPYDMLYTARIDSVKDVRLPEDYLRLEDTSPPFKPFFCDRVDHPNRFHVFHAYLRAFFSYPNPFDVVDEPSVDQPSSSISIQSLPSSSTSIQSSASSSTSIQSSTSLASRTVKNKSSQGQPYNRKTGQTPKPSAGRNKFVEEPNPLIPPAIPAWRRALAQVNTDPANQAGCFSHPTDAGYAFPEPGVIYGGQSPERQAKLILSWLQQRPALIYRLTSSSSSARVLSNQSWRTMLTYGNAPISVGSQGQTKSSHRRADMRQLLGNCLDEVGLELVPGDDHVFWREQELSTGVLPSSEICQEILWELYELNFRFELLALHRRAQLVVDDSPEHQDRVLACFPGHGPLLVADLSLANQGLAASAVAERAPYLLALKRLMKGWKGDVPSQIGADEKPVEQYSVVELTFLEQAVAKFYTQSFFNFFGRAAIVPHRLQVPLSEH